MKKKIALAAVLALAIILPGISLAAGFVNCGNAGQKACTADDLVTTAKCILSFIVTDLAIPLATIAIIVGAILFLVSAGNPNLAGIGKRIIWSAIIGLVLALCTVVIINFILQGIGATKYKLDITASCPA